MAFYKVGDRILNEEEYSAEFEFKFKIAMFLVVSILTWLLVDNSIKTLVVDEDVRGSLAFFLALIVGWACAKWRYLVIGGAVLLFFLSILVKGFTGINVWELIF